MATRFIGLFESKIQELVALATLMPIVASIGGNTGTQTVALVIRELAHEQLTDDSRRHLLRKELARIFLEPRALFRRWPATVTLTPIARV